MAGTVKAAVFLELYEGEEHTEGSTISDYIIRKDLNRHGCGYPFGFQIFKIRHPFIVTDTKEDSVIITLQ